MLDTQKITVTTTGTAGNASGTGYSPRPMSGEVRALYVNWSGSAPNTSDITITVEADDDHPVVTLYQKDNAVTDLWVYPSVLDTDTAGANLTGWYHRPVVSGRISVAVAGCDALAAAVVVTVYIDTLGD